MASYDTVDVVDAEINVLNWFKIAELGLLPDRRTWATNILTANKNITTVTIPHDLRPGNYIVRHEIISLHAATEDTSTPPPPGTKVGSQVSNSLLNMVLVTNLAGALRLLHECRSTRKWYELFSRGSE
jgi:hypothetical protein